MSTATLELPLPIPISSSVGELAVAFPRELQRVVDRLKAIQGERADDRKKPSVQTLDWARGVLLRVVPSTYLIGAEINPFESEIHVTWEDENAGKSVIIFFTALRQIKIYKELVRDDAVVEHGLVSATSESDVSNYLRWFFSND